MLKPKKINNFTLSKSLKSFKTEYLNGGKSDSTEGLINYPGGEGTLVFRKKIDSKDRAQGYFVYRFSTPEGKTDKIPLGRFSESEDGISFAQANAMTEPHRASLRKGINPKLALEERKARSDTNSEGRRYATFEDVIRFYIYYQKETHKIDAANVERELEKNVLTHKSKMRKYATDVTETDVEDIIKAMVKRGVKRASNRVKTYVTTAFNMAKKRTAQMANLREQGFPDVDFKCIKLNPAAEVGTDPEFENVKENNLTETQLKDFYQSITLNEEETDKFLLDRSTFYFITMDIALGGQRKRQLMNVTWDNVDINDRVIEIVDRKGTNAKPKHYILYLNDLAFKCLTELREITGGEGSIYPFSESYVPKEFRKYSEWRGKTIKYDGLRSTCTTLMKRKLDFTTQDFDKEDVKRVQNHKIDGVQEIHYDKNDYWQDKRKLIILWGQYLESVGVWA